MPKGQRIEEEKRVELSNLLRAARKRLKWSAEKLAEEATRALIRVAADQSFPATAEERKFWADFFVTRRHVTNLENYPARPMGSQRRRAELLGVVLALEVDRGLVSRLCGGV